jgi:hypothetical protein
MCEHDIKKPDILKPWQIEPELWTQFKQQGLLKLGGVISITHPTLNQVCQIAQFLQGEEALVPVNINDVVKAIELGLDLIALDDNSQQIIGHQAMGLWPALKLVELRSAKVLESYRGQGINTVMKKLAIGIGLETYPDCQPMAFTEAASKSRGILAKLGFAEKPMSQVREQWFELSSLCPNKCYLKTGHDCGCKVFTLNTHE